MAFGAGLRTSTRSSLGSLTRPIAPHALTNDRDAFESLWNMAVHQRQLRFTWRWSRQRFGWGPEQRLPKKQRQLDLPDVDVGQPF